MKVITALIITLAVGVGATSVYYNDKLNDQKELTDQANAKVQQLKEQDEVLFNDYREVINAAADMFSCTYKDCLEQKTDKVNEIKSRVDASLEDRKDLVGAEQ